MQTIYQTALDVIVKWPDEKYIRMIGYMRDNLDPRDVAYIEARRRVIREHDATFPRLAAFTLR
jgi:hypothetical protein